MKTKYVNQIKRQIKELKWLSSEINKSYCQTTLVLMPRFPKTYQNIQSLLRSKIRNLTLDLAKIKGTHSKKEWEDLRAKFKGICPVCKKSKKLTKDHIFAICLGGSDSIKNIQPLCHSCNSRKHAS